MRIIHSWSLVLIVFLLGCSREIKVIYPLTPFINYEHFDLSKQLNSMGDTIVVMNIELDYIDGDSNIGGLTDYEGYETINGMFVLYKLVQGKMQMLDTSKYNNPRFYFIPKINISGASIKNDSVEIIPKSLYEGELKIQIEFDYPMVEYNMGDSAKFEIQIIDRDLNFSNKVAFLHVFEW